MYSSEQHGKQTLWLAYSALRKLVVAEYPRDRSISDIVQTWGEGLTGDEIAAIQEIEGTRSRPETGRSLTDQSSQVPDVFLRHDLY
jgi:hypothetical protein